MIPHRLAFKLIDGGYTFRDDQQQDLVQEKVFQVTQNTI